MISPPCPTSLEGNALPWTTLSRQRGHIRSLMSDCISGTVQGRARSCPTLLDLPHRLTTVRNYPCPPLTTAFPLLTPDACVSSSACMRATTVTWPCLVEFHPAGRITRVLMAEPCAKRRPAAYHAEKRPGSPPTLLGHALRLSAISHSLLNAFLRQLGH